ncbi:MULTISPECIES: hypothetical protein [Pseudoalteromonas]|uniref:DUF2244 domain-containing protein n=1 Tax=Pseudoalteromonas shioyasakiensis TaxID=1190813 RepID=A0ABT6U1U6_9GAMM|nr:MULTISPECIES: hypothetical protein [Pseudoalteromonas]MCG9734325.1 hypothetical protein [Pseudoalteromonas shioyasakiensis]MCO7207063.1 hypothetical protein [Pseudoalteromonas sp. CnMc7-37]MCZ4251427.1 hypothetical protein [Pseudoalteromonas shioyasakiensis]MDI4670096.1 hypothetical protein [Pseudoalteromonas shioyasakiensis]MDI4675012.1 hypothetical protein [Pseudoalteromonas shioyasakiensis]
MKTIKLSPNWTLQGSKIALAILVALSVTLLGASILMLLLPVLLFITLLNFLELRFLHCYKAGICYSRGLGKRYINAEDIVTVEFNPMAFITVFKITLANGKTHQFMNWQIDEQQQIDIAKLYKSKAGCAIKPNLQCKA